MVHILRGSWKKKLSVWTGWFVFDFSYWALCCFFNKELLHFVVTPGSEAGCLADVEGGACCCVTLAKIPPVCSGPKRLLEVDKLSVSTDLGSERR